MRTPSRSRWLVALVAIGFAAGCGDGSGPSDEEEGDPDITGPTAVAITPMGDGIATNARIEVTFNEPIVTSGATGGLKVFSGSRQVDGASVTSSDSLTLSFFPSGTLPENGVFGLELQGVTDTAGNQATLPDSACFVTELTVPAKSVIADGVGDLWDFGTGAIGTSPSDLVESRYAIEDSMLSGVLEFSTPRSLDTLSPNNLLHYIEIDIDQDTTTGFGALKDLFFDLVDSSFASGTKVDYVVGLEPVDPDGLSYVGQLDADSVTVTDLFRPGLCGKFVGFSTSMANLGNDDGNMDLVSLSVNFEGNPGAFTTPFILDPSPTSGKETLSFAGLFSPPITTMAPSPVRRRSVRVRLPIPR